MLMFVAGILVWANVNPPITELLFFIDGEKHGWPFVIHHNFGNGNGEFVLQGHECGWFQKVLGNLLINVGFVVILGSFIERILLGELSFRRKCGYCAVAIAGSLLLILCIEKSLKPPFRGIGGFNMVSIEMFGRGWPNPFLKYYSNGKILFSKWSPQVLALDFLISLAVPFIIILCIDYYFLRRTRKAERKIRV